MDYVAVMSTDVSRTRITDAKSKSERAIGRVASRRWPAARLTISCDQRSDLQA